MPLIDTHCHLYCEEFDADREQAIQRAVESGVATMLLPAIDSQTLQRQEQLATAYPQYFRQMAGLHPTSVTDRYEEELTIVERLLSENPDKYVALGEIGLDLYWDKTYKDQQISVLKRQLSLAQHYQLPVCLHIRNAYEEMFQVLSDLNTATYQGVFHCFSGTLEQAHLASEMGFHLGIGGVLTYKKSTLPDIIKAVPLDRLVLETDCPYLAPVPFRGRRNESSYIKYVASSLADILGLSFEQISQSTTANAQSLFHLQP